MMLICKEYDTPCYVDGMEKRVTEMLQQYPEFVRDADAFRRAKSRACGFGVKPSLPYTPLWGVPAAPRRPFAREDVHPTHPSGEKYQRTRELV
jgi:hypothetical protein